MEKGEIKMTIQNLVNEIFEKSFSRESLERLLTKEIKKKLETAMKYSDYNFQRANEIVKEIIKSE